LGLIGKDILNCSVTHIILNINTCVLFYKIGVNTGVIQQEQGSFLQQLELNLRKKLAKCYIWSIALYGAEIWTFQRVGRKDVENFETWCWKRTDQLGRSYEKWRSILQWVKRRGIFYKQ